MHSKPTSLFTRLIMDHEADPDYLWVRDDPGAAEDRKLLAELWERYHPLADRHFVSELQSNGKFEARVWEMRLGCVLLDLGLKVRSDNSGPDFRVQDESGLEVLIEAVAPQQGSAPALDRPQSGGQRNLLPYPEQEVLLRFTSSLSAKISKYKAYLASQCIDPGAPYVVAVSGGAIWAANIDASPPRIAKVLYGIGAETWTLDPATGSTQTTHREQRGRANANGSEVPCDLFLDDSACDVSAVIFAAKSFLNRPQASGARPGSDFRIIHNMCARNPLPRGFLHCGDEWAVVENNFRQIADWARVAAP